MDAGSHANNPPESLPPPPSDPALSRPRKIVVNKTNFTTLHDGPNGDGTDVIVDIVLVHGLGGGPEKTWSTEKLPITPADEQTRRRRDRVWKRFRKEKSIDNVETSSTDQKQGKFWPADFLPAACPSARILTWGYDSKVTLFFSGTADQGDYHSHAKDLLYDLNDMREDQKRPVIWIAHSLGGIIVEEALLHAQTRRGDESLSSLKSIYDSTRRILFLGTPHRGSSVAPWGTIAERLVKVAGFDTNGVILKQLSTQSRELEDLNERFINLWKNNHVFEIITYRETNGIYGLNGKVVEDFSSTIADEPQRTIPGNHINMCVFSSEDDSGYRRIKADVCRCVRQIEDIRKRGVSLQAEINRSDTLHKPESLKSESQSKLDITTQLMPNPSIFGSRFLLLNAIEKGDEWKVRKLLENRSNIEYENLPFQSNLSLAVRKGNIEIIKLLLDHGTNIESTSLLSEETVLLEATKARSHAIAKLLLRRGAKTQSTDSRGYSSLHIACECGDEELVELLLIHGANLEQVCSDSMNTPLLLAARLGRSAIVDLLIKRGAIIDAADSRGKTSLHLVAELWNNKISRSLLRAGANSEAKDSVDQRAPLHYAAKNAHFFAAKELLQNRAHPDTKAGNGQTALHLAAEYGHLDIVELLISKGASTNIPLDGSRTVPLHLASANGYHAVVKALIEAGADTMAIQYPTSEGKTSLHLAAQNGHHLVVSILCSEKTVEEKDNINGNTPLLLAALGGHTLAAKILLENNAEIEARNNQGLKALYLALKDGKEEFTLLLLDNRASTRWPVAAITPMQYAASLGQTSVVQKFLELGDDINYAGPTGETALIYAASAGRTATVYLLLSNKAAVDLQNCTGLTALRQASRNGHGDTVSLLLKSGADFKLGDKTGRTVLHDAASRGHEDVVRLLIGTGADCTASDDSFITPLHLAALSGHDNIIHLLVGAGAAIDALASIKRTSFAFACQKGHVSTARILLANGAQVTTPDIEPPIIAAARGGHLDVIDLLESHRSVDGLPDEAEALIVAAYHGYTLAVKKLLRWKGIDINAVRHGELSALHHAAINGHVTTIRALLEEGADISQRSYMNWLPIHGAALNGHASSIRALLNAGSDVECMQDIFSEELSSLRDSDQESLVRLFVDFAAATTRFYTSIKDGELETICEQATNKLYVKMRDGSGNTALHVAAEYNCTATIPILCNIGVGIETKNILGQTALHRAVLCRNFEAQHMLLQYGCDVNAKACRGFTPLHAAILVKEEVSIRILLEAGADPSIHDCDQMDILQFAEEQGYEIALPILRKYLKEGHKE